MGFGYHMEGIYILCERDGAAIKKNWEVVGQLNQLSPWDKEFQIGWGIHA